MATVIETLDYYDIKHTNTGPEVMFICPFHNDTSFGSAFFNLHKEVFKCFSCKAGGSLYQFVADLEHCDLEKAVQLVDSDFVGIFTDTESVQKVIDKKIDKLYVGNVEGYTIELIEALINRLYTRLVGIDLHTTQQVIEICTYIMYYSNRYDKDAILNIYKQLSLIINEATHERIN